MIANGGIQQQGAWLEVSFSEPHSVLSWAVVGGGWKTAKQVLWHQVSNRDLPLDVDPIAYFQKQIRQEMKDSEAVAFLTSAPIADYTMSCQESEGQWARCIATVGLSNALRIGDPAKPSKYGTINLLVQTSLPLDFSASLEAISLIAEARSLAMIEAQVISTASQQLATGTGTDCIAIASPHAGTCETYAGKHTHVGHLIGRAAFEATAQGIQKWKARQR